MAEKPTVKIPDIRREVNLFLDKLYGGEEGVVYAPTLDRKLPPKEGWDQQFFNWPAERDSIVEHVIKSTGNRECYISPSLFKVKGNSRKENLKGSKVVWAELDGKELQPVADLPAPSFWLQSSNEGHTHIYWELDKFCPDVNMIEDVNRAVTTALGADSSGWDANQVLRFPLTANHKRGVFTGPLQVNQAPEHLFIGSFSSIPRPEISLTLDKFNLDKVPGNINEMAWLKVLGEKGTELFFEKEIGEGDRSTAMMALAYYMAENDNPGWTDYEMFAVLYGADEKWGKFKGRRDRNQRLIDIIVKARQKYPSTVGNEFVDKEFGYISLTQLLEETKPVEYTIPGLLIEYGSFMLVGMPGTGKTQMTMQIAMHMACGKTYLKYELVDPKRAIFFSLEMGDSELLSFAEKMAKSFTAEERELIDQNLRIYPIGQPVYMNSKEGQRVIDSQIAEFQPEGVFVDSYSMALMGDLNSDTAVNDMNAWVKQQRMKHKCFFWFIHHMRKSQQGNKKPKHMDDIYGSTFIAAGITNASLLWKSGNSLEFSSLKNRHDKPEATYRIIRDENTLMFGIDGIAGITQAAEAEVEEGEDNDPNRPGVPPTF